MDKSKSNCNIVDRQELTSSTLLISYLACSAIEYRGVARIFGLGGGQTVPCRAEPDPASTEVVKPVLNVSVLAAIALFLYL